ncbi:hypothetical protein A0H81_11027 [Grifola frondosa]|uniref:Uncharacterized protein n=1 Tax=Grifola frondosa TaxID=5627 RepID=A0A1C7LVI9_GRIFR|nr:hypothetical protein A0H81_11027 [Grifola frondosa]
MFLTPFCLITVTIFARRYLKLAAALAVVLLYIRNITLMSFQNPASSSFKSSASSSREAPQRKYWNATKDIVFSRYAAEQLFVKLPINTPLLSSRQALLSCSSSLAVSRVRYRDSSIEYSSQPYCENISYATGSELQIRGRHVGSRDNPGTMQKAASWQGYWPERNIGFGFQDTRLTWHASAWGDVRGSPTADRPSCHAAARSLRWIGVYARLGALHRDSPDKLQSGASSLLTSPAASCARHDPSRICLQLRMGTVDQECRRPARTSLSG